MEQSGNKTIMCSVLFLDIVEYSRKSVAGQISLKDRFDCYLSKAISSVPIADRIILDTGDGAAVNFIGDVEDALRTVFSLRESLLNEAPDVDPPLRMRMGINLGPVRLVMDINGQPNVVGDGVNVAQRVMGFAEPGQILASRSYCDAVSRLSPQYADLFHFMGSRTDKHVREHEVYVVGRPGENTTELIAATLLAKEDDKSLAPTSSSANAVWNTAVDAAIGTIKQADPKQRALYAGVFVAAILLVGVLLFKVRNHDQPSDGSPQAGPTLAAAPAMPASIPPDSTMTRTSSAQPDTEAGDDANAKKIAEGKAGGKNATAKTGLLPAQPKTKAVEPNTDKAPLAEKRDSVHAYISVICKNDVAKVFVDLVQRGVASRGGVVIPVSPGKHEVFVNLDNGILNHKQKIDLPAGKTVSIAPKFCD
jgi:class 3 adenylate cyclase